MVEVDDEVGVVRVEVCWRVVEGQVAVLADADAGDDALLAYLDTGAAPGTIVLESTFVAGGEGIAAKPLTSPPRRRRP